MASSLNRNAFNTRVVAWTEAHHFWIIFQRVVNNPPIVRVHRIELNRTAGDPDGLGNLPHTLSQLVVPHRSPMTDVDLNSARAPILRLKNPVEKKLQIFERLTFVTDQCVAFRRKHLELTPILSLDFLNVCHEAEVAEHRIQYLLGFHFFRGVNDYDLAITLSLGNLRTFRNPDERGIRLIFCQIHLGDEKEILNRPV